MPKHRPYEMIAAAALLLIASWIVWHISTGRTLVQAPIRVARVHAVATTTFGPTFIQPFECAKWESISVMGGITKPYPIAVPNCTEFTPSQRRFAFVVDYFDEVETTKELRLTNPIPHTGEYLDHMALLANEQVTATTALFYSGTVLGAGGLLMLIAQLVARRRARR